MNEFQQYPKMLYHPDHEGERYPPVTVNNAAEELRYTAEGYLATGISDPTAFEAARSRGAPPQAVAEFPHFPKWVTLPTGDQALVKSPSEEAALTAMWADPKRLEISPESAA